MCESKRMRVCVCESKRMRGAKLWQLSESGHLSSKICKLRTGLCVHTHTHARTHTHTHTHTHTRTRTHIHTHAHARTYTHTHRRKVHQACFVCLLSHHYPIIQRTISLTINMSKETTLKKRSFWF